MAQRSRELHLLQPPRALDQAVSAGHDRGYAINLLAPSKSQARPVWQLKLHRTSNP